ncbi:MAG: Vms1/Ankzf1 family peptidyl-tRNA hydrolase [Thermodesulfovibrionales bacterium]|nr:Vms1/Ankzf1 family peptidyl-tRNA hydrolase [Thermodesulfovibrionales bacterium]MDP3112476.1 Vms1/Ankzf1 family peptidyl-tRNA hydrolase [Thermodesulfovibrionales bacterium]
MLNREELREIAALQGNGSYFVSLYLNVNPVTNAKGDYIIHFKNMLRDISEGTDKKILKKIKADIGNIESFFISSKRGFKKGLAILSSSEQSFWKEYNLAVPVRNEIVVDKTPHIKQLLDIIDNYQRYAVLLVDKEAARLFLVHLGEIEEYGEIHTPDIPGKHKKGGWFALSQNHYERHIDYHVGLHLKDVMKKLELFLAEEEIRGIVIGGSEDAVIRVREMLPRPAGEKVIGSFSAEMFAGNNEIFEKVKLAIGEFERKKQKTTVSELLTAAMKRENAVLGIEDVLNAIQEGRIMKLVFINEFRDSGYACRKCRYLTRQKVSPCPYCSGEMEGVGYLVELAAQRTVEMGALVEVISDNRELSNAGGIGAFLRF